MPTAKRAAWDVHAEIEAVATVERRFDSRGEPLPAGNVRRGSVLTRVAGANPAALLLLLAALWILVCAWIGAMAYGAMVDDARSDAGEWGER